eukprot:UN16225
MCGNYKQYVDEIFEFAISPVPLNRCKSQQNLIATTRSLYHCLRLRTLLLDFPSRRVQSFH